MINLISNRITVGEPRYKTYDSYDEAILEQYGISEKLNKI